ncbi:MAG TPA: hypothetical protein VHU83_22360 [Bryobacteraceae bacterium]|nr:hypothetical protein [Bryobacteraceae bacterium]
MTRASRCDDRALALVALLIAGRQHGSETRQGAASLCRRQLYVVTPAHIGGALAAYKEKD